MPVAEPTAAKATARADAEVRLAAHPSTHADTLAQLARDGRVIVRAAVAMNPATPARVDHALARDGDERIRSLLARKLAQLAPSLSDAHRTAWQEQAYGTLSLLAQDAATQVRAAISDVVNAMADAPRELILRLAHDTALSVSEPVIRMSPLLTPADLIALLDAPPHPATASAIAARDGLDPALSDRIAGGADAAAITALLRNHSAAIREATLDALTARAAREAAQHPEWQEPLTRRPELSEQAMRALSEFVTVQLLAALAQRSGLSPSLLLELKQRLTERLRPATAALAPAAGAGRAATMEAAMQEALALQADGRLDEAALLTAAQRGDERACLAMLAAAAGVAGCVVERAATLRSGKAIVSLIWDAGFSMRVAGPLQILIGRLAPEAVLRPSAAGGFPLATDEMRWQLDLLNRMGR